MKAIKKLFNSVPLALWLFLPAVFIVGWWGGYNLVRYIMIHYF